MNTPPPPVPASPPPPPSTSRLKGCLVVVGLMVLLGSLMINLLLFFALVANTGSGSSVAGSGLRDYQEELLEGDADEKEAILQLEINGVITNFSESELKPSMVQTFRRQIKQGLKDDKVKAILVKINSPGGEVLASDILYHEIKLASEKKPLLVYMGSVAASGGFYAAMGADIVMANELTLTGSIGVIVQTLTYQQAGEKIGVTFNTFTSGPNKAMFGGAKPISPEQAAIIQGIIAQSYSRFLGIVAKSRDLEADQLKQVLADGRVLTGQQALDGKLVDELGYLEDAYAKARDMAKAKDAKIVRYRPEISFLDFFNLFGEVRVPAKIEVDLWPDLPKVQPGLPYYLAPHLLPGQ